MRAAACVFWVLVLAGCAGTETADDSEDVQFSDGSTVDLDEGTDSAAGLGSISGVVVDETISPIAGAVVQIDRVPGNITTDDNGVFRATDLEPGLYVVRAEGEGFLQVQTTAEVVADGVAKVKVVLPRDDSPQPSHNTLVYDWYDSVGQPLVDFAWDLLRPGGAPALCDQCEWTFESNGAAQSFVIEAFWEDTVTPPHQDARFYVTIEPTEDSSDYESEYCTHPCYYRIDDNRWPNAREFFIMLAYEESWIAVEQKAEVFITMFYVEGAPEGWSIQDEA